MEVKTGLPSPHAQVMLMYMLCPQIPLLDSDGMGGGIENGRSLIGVLLLEENTEL